MPSFLKLNNLFPNDKTIDDVIQYKQTQEFPENINTTAKRKRFLEKYQSFELENGKLFYNNQNQHLQVVKKTEIPEILNEIYDSPNGLGGIVIFYKYIQTKYINIKSQKSLNF
jgi:hypothetical protein